MIIDNSLFFYEYMAVGIGIILLVASALAYNYAYLRAVLCMLGTISLVLGFLAGDCKETNIKYSIALKAAERGVSITDLWIGKQLTD